MTDARIALRFGDHPFPGEAALIEGDAPMADGVPVARFRLPALGTHVAGCACCLPRGPVSEALGALFLARARGETRFFTAVVAVTATAAGRRAVADALDRDPLVSGRFRAG